VGGLAGGSAEAFRIHCSGLRNPTPRGALDGKSSACPLDMSIRLLSAPADWKIELTPNFKPGQAAPFSGQYQVVGPRGGVRSTEVTSVKGKPLPPTASPGETYKIVDRTNNKSGGRK
jgi:hypothetical protein